MATTTVSNFTVIPVLYDSSTTHYLYARSHHSSGSRKKARALLVLPEGRTLFLVNVPPDATERELVLFFKHAGTVERVVFGNETPEQDEVAEDEEEEDGDEEDDAAAMDEDEEDDDMDDAEEPTAKSRKNKKSKDEEIPRVIPLPVSPLRKLRKTGVTAHIIFLDASSLERALASTSKPRAWPSSSSSTTATTTTLEPCGLAHYKALYTSLRPPLDAIKAFADSSMQVYEYDVQKQKEKQISQYKKGEAIVDDEGFTLVTRGGAYGKTLGGGVAVASKQFQRSVGQARNRGLQKKDKREKEGFYGFQKEQKQRADLLELKRKWEEDKARVEKLKASRRFKPY